MDFTSDYSPLHAKLEKAASAKALTAFFSYYLELTTEEPLPEW
jgi:hypothetical protein